MAGGGRRPRVKKRPEVIQIADRMFDRPVPTAVVAEMALLGACILEHTVIEEVAEIIGDEPDVWSSEAHAAIWDAMRAVVDQCRALDLVLLGEKLSATQVLEHVGGLAYLEKLTAETPGPATAVHYAKQVARAFCLRRAIAVGGTMVHDAYQAAGDPDELLARAEAGVFAIVDRWMSVGKVDSGGRLTDLVLAHLQRMHALQDGTLKNAGEGTLATGFTAIDEMTGGGLHPGQLVIVGARPSMGKTSFGMGCALGMAVSAVADAAALTETGEVDTAARKWVVMVSLEMAREDIATRYVSASSGIPYQRLLGRRAVGSETMAKDGTRRRWVSALSEDETRSVGHAAARLAELPLYVDDQPSMSMAQLRSRVRRLSRTLGQGVGAVLVDYLQLLTDRGHENRQQEVASISRGLKAMALELGVPVMALCQLNRGPESRSDKRPTMADLRESGSIEQDADVVMLLHREAYYHKAEPSWAAENPRDEHAGEVIIAKQRNGPTDVVRLAFHAPTGWFVPWREDVWGGRTMAGVEFGGRLHTWAPGAVVNGGGTPFDGPTIGPGGRA